MPRLVQGGADWLAAVEATEPGCWLALFEAWSAIEPAVGAYDEARIETHRRALIAARRRGLEVVLTVHAGALPDWQIARDGWLDGDALAGFGCYVDRLAHAYGELVRHWVGVQEPLGEAALYGADGGRVSRALLDAQSSAWLHLRKAPGPGGGGTLVGVAERFDQRPRRRDQLLGRAIGGLLRAMPAPLGPGPGASPGVVDGSAPHALVRVLATGRLAPPFGAFGELSGGSPALDFVVAVAPSLVDLHRVWQTGRSVIVLGAAPGVDQQAEAEGVRVLAVG